MHYEKFPDGTVKCIEDEIPFELPEGWEWTRLDILTTLVTDYVANGSFATLKANVRTYKEKNYALFVRTVDFANNFEKDLSYIDKESYDFLDKSRLYGGELMLSNIGASIGKVFKIPYFDFPMSLAPNSIILKFHYNTTSDFFEYVFRSFVGQDYLQRLTAGTAMPKFNKTELKQMLVPLPTLTEQERIIAKIKELLSIVDFIESDKTDLQTTIQLTKSKILDLAIRGKLVPQNPDDEPANVLLDRIRAEKEGLIKQGKIKRDKKESVIFRGDDNSYYEKIGDTVTCIDEELPFDIPENWAWVRLSSACIINPKNSIADDTVISFVPMTLIQDGYANEFTFEQRKWGEVKKGFTHFAENDVGFAKITPCFENRKSVVFRGLCNGYGAGTTELYILRTFPDTVLPEYILYVVKTESFLVGGKQTCAGVVGQQRISKDYVCDYLVPVPPLNEQVRIINKCAEIMTMLHNIEKSLS